MLDLMKWLREIAPNRLTLQDAWWPARLSPLTKNPGSDVSRFRQQLSVSACNICWTVV